MKKTKDKFLNTLKEKKINKKTIDLIDQIDRKKFFDPYFSNKIYEFEPIPIGHGEKSEDPFILAKMIQLLSLKKKWKVLEIGTGSGFSTSIIASEVSKVISIEYNEALAKSAKERVIDEGFFNVRFYAGDATEMDKELGKFDAVIIFAACFKNPSSITNILNDEGIAVFPMGPPFQQQIIQYKKPPLNDISDNLTHYKFYDFCEFSSIRGKYGWVDQ